MLIINRIIKKRPFNRFRKRLNKKISLNNTIPKLTEIYPPADVTSLEIDNVIEIIDKDINVNNIENFNLSLTIFECFSFYIILIMYIIAATINKIILTIDRNKRIK
tara:strand:+ start:4998 stop:5315 length:318 start_codon:yes stop_codon:yes gene_type:complete